MNAFVIARRIREAHGEVTLAPGELLALAAKLDELAELCAEFAILLEEQDND